MVDLAITGVQQIVHATNLLLTILGDVEDAIGGDQNDTIYGTAGPNILTGGPGDDTLEGRGGSDTYVFGDGWGNDNPVVDTGGNEIFDFSTVTTSLTFDYGITIGCIGICITDGSSTVASAGNIIENFYGGTNADIFILQNGFVLGGMIDGQGGTDTIDFSNFVVNRSVVLNALGSIDGYIGSDPSIPSGFDNINDLIGSSDTGDAITGLGFDSHWTLNTAGSTYSEDVSGRVLTFIGFEKLNGTTANDHFTIEAGPQAADIQGGTGNDTFRGNDKH